MDAFAALSDSTRREIVEMLGGGARSAGAIGERFPISAPAVSQHLKVLRDSGLVRVRVDGQRRVYSLDPNGLAALDHWFARMRQHWSKSLDALERELEKEQADDDD